MMTIGNPARAPVDRMKRKLQTKTGQSSLPGAHDDSGAGLWPDQAGARSSGLDARGSGFRAAASLR
jgi:hypothetical protein